jgi:hypothetical protein
MDPKTHHYVPQFYLKAFSIKKPGKKDEYQIWCYDKVKEEARFQNIRDVAAENYFYNYVQEDGTKASIEKELSLLETEFSKSLLDICNNSTKKTLMRNKAVIAEFLALQYVRTSARLKYMRDLEGETQRVANELGSPIPVLEEAEYQRLFIKFITSYKSNEVNTYLAKEWFLIHNRYYKVLPFWTSDNPVVFSDKDGDANFLLPISPRLMILVKDSRYYPENCERGYADGTFISEANLLQVVSSQRLLLSITEEFHLAKVILKVAPELKDPNRERFNLSSMGSKFADIFTEQVKDISEAYKLQ